MGPERIITDVGIRERAFGSMEGQTLGKLYRLANEAKEEIAQYTPADGETAGQARERVIKFLTTKMLQDVKNLNRNNPEILLVSHGGAIREMISYFKSFKHPTFVGNSFNGKEFGRIPPNTSLNKFGIVFDAEKLSFSSVECLSLHDISHMSEDMQNNALKQKQVNNRNGPGV